MSGMEIALLAGRIMRKKGNQMRVTALRKRKPNRQNKMTTEFRSPYVLGDGIPLFLPFPNQYNARITR